MKRDFHDLKGSIPLADAAAMDASVNKIAVEAKREKELSKLRYKLTKEVINAIKFTVEKGETEVIFYFTRDREKYEDAVNEDFLQMFRDAGYRVSFGRSEYSFYRKLILNFGIGIPKGKQKHKKTKVLEPCVK